MLSSLSLSRIEPSPFNPTSRTADKDLVESIKQVGVLQPVLVRPRPGGPKDGITHQLVFGHRRFDGATKARLEEIPVTERELDDVTVLKFQLTENLKRKDLHPLDEAEGYELLHKAPHNLPVEAIAAEIGRSKVYVYSTMNLLRLGKPAQLAFREGKLDRSKALLIATRVPSSLQDDVVKRLSATDQWSGQSMSYRQARDLVERDFLLKLADAPFKMADGELVPKAGACTACPKRTGNQPELFEDVKSKDVCTDKVCFQSKVGATWERMAEAAQKAGKQVLPAKDAKTLWPSGGRYGLAGASGYLDLDVETYEIGGKSWRAAFGKKAELPPITLARDPEGGIHELVDAQLARAALRKAGVIKTPAKSSSSSSSRPKTTPAQRKAAQANAELMQKVGDEAMVAIVAAAEKGLTRPGLLWLALDMADRFQWDTDISERRDWSGAIESKIEKLDEKQLRGVLVEFVLGTDLHHTDVLDERMVMAAKAFGVDLKAIEKRLKLAADAGAKAEAAKPAKPKKGKKS